MKTSFWINVRPVSISLECPHCDREQIIEWGNIEAPECWSEHWGYIECPECGKEIELGDHDVDW